MIRVSVLYPNSDGNTFDHDYFVNKHMVLVHERLGDALVSSDIEEGIAGGNPGEPPPFMALAHMSFNSLEEFEAAFAPHSEEILGDIPNYTNAAPTMQISQVRA